MHTDYSQTDKAELIELLERSEAENLRLHRQAETMLKVYNMAPVPTVVMKPDGEVIEVNQCACETFGWNRDTLIGKAILVAHPDCLSETERQNLWEHLGQLTMEHPALYHYMYHLLPSKRVVHYLWCYAGIFDPEGALKQMIGYCMPTNLQEELEKEMREEVLRNMQIEQDNHKVIADVLHMLTKQDTLSCENLLQLANSHYHSDYTAVFRYNEQHSSYLMKDFAITPECTLNKYIPQIKTQSFFSKSNTLEHFRRGNTKIVYKDDKTESIFMAFLEKAQIQFESMLIVPLFVNGHFHGFLATLREHYDLRWSENEISLFQLLGRVVSINIERIIIQKKLERGNRLTTLALEGSEIYSWEYDLDKDFFYNNQALLKRFGYPVGEQPTFTMPMFFDAVHPEELDSIRKAFVGVQEGRNGDVQCRMLMKNQDDSYHYEWFEFRFMSLRKHANDHFNYVIGTCTCIEKFKQNEYALIQAKQAAEESNRLKSAFLANMSHEIRTPLNAIVGFSSVLADTTDETEKREYVSIIENNNALLLQLIGDILDLSKIEAGTLEFHHSRTDINVMMTEIEQSAQLRRTNESVEIVFEERQPECIASTDRQRVMQVLNNFINNAMKFTEKGSIRFGYRLRDDRTFRFYVTDTGCGISPEDQQKVFGRFVKLNTFVQGSGLGLSICESIIRSLGGEIGVDSTPGQGSTFWFTIPYFSSEVPQPGTDNRQECCGSAESYTVQRPTLLIAEDNSSNYRLFESLLKKEYDLIHAWDGQAAVQLFKIHHPHLILMDIKMPIMDGYQATAEIRKLSPSVPIVAVTAYAFAEDEARALQNGFDAYVSKPISSSIRSTIRSLLEKRTKQE